MKFFGIMSLVAAASAIRVSYDTGYDNGSRSMTVVACSDGTNGLISRYGYQTQGQVPGYIGGTQFVSGWNSAQCGTCWRLSYGGRSVYVTAVDHAGSGFNIQLDAMNALTGGQGAALGAVDASYTQVGISSCGR